MYDVIPDHERILVDVLRQIIIEHLPSHGKEKISYNVPFFYGHKSICLVWPSAIPRGGIKSGVMIAFWYGHRLPNQHNYLDHGTNKQIYYKIFQTVDDIDLDALGEILKEAVALDHSWKK